MLNLNALIKLAQKMGAKINNAPKEQGGLFYIENGVKKICSFNEEYKKLIKSQNMIDLTEMLID